MRAGRGDLDVVVVGAGVVGCSLATLLIKRGMAAPGRVAVLAERFPQPPRPESDWDLRVYALSRASEHLLRLCGIWQQLPAERRHPYERMRVWDAKAEPLSGESLLFDAAELGEPNLGYIVDAAHLAYQAVQMARGAGVTFIEATLAGLLSGVEGVKLTLGDTRTLGAQLIVGADGVDSKVRELLDITTAGHAYHQDALVAHVQGSAPHQATAWQRFLPTGPIAFLPLPDGRCSIVWSCERARADALRGLSAPAFDAALTEASGGALGDIRAVSAVASFPLRLQYAERYAQPHAVLMGDAAHVVHPLAGQGLNLGLLDCATLIEELEGADTAAFGDLRVLRRYERRRRSENILAGAGLDGLERLFAAGEPFARLRRLGFWAVQRASPVKRLLMARALGTAGDVPALVRAGGAFPQS
jgi:2-octaprenylphenol hydroxylase